MIIVGELINSSRKSIKEAIDKKDSEFIRKIAKDQAEAGADYIDVNAGTFVDTETEHLKWMIENVQQVVDVPCCIDSPDPKALEAALKIHKGTAMINSISLEEDRYDAILPIVAGTDLKIVALCMSSEGMPQTCDERLKIADKLVDGLVKNNVPIDNIYMDPLVQPIGTDSSFGFEFLDAVGAITKEFEGIHTMCGLSNISFGLPERKFINRIFAVMAVARGLDGLIIDPLDKAMMGSLVTAETLAGRDDYCCKYLKAFRKGIIG